MPFDPHPEDLLDRGISGVLTETEQRRLEQHLMVCGACRSHLDLARAARISETPHPWDGHADELAVDGALTRFGSERRPLFLRKRSILLIAAALVALGGIASAAWLRASAIESKVAPPSGVNSARLPAVLVSNVNSFDERAAATPPSAQPVTPSSSERDGASNLEHALPPSAGALFEQASTLRAENRATEAIAVFRKLQALYPQSRESRLSFVLAGRLLLDRGRAAQAVTQFDRYLAQGGEAAEEALAGRASALGQLGRHSEELSAWQQLLARYPKSVYAKLAQTRSTELRAD